MKLEYHNIEQNTDEWQDLRTAKATSSNYKIFMANDGQSFGDPARRYAFEIALERITGVKTKNSYTSEHMIRGNEQEPEARECYEEEKFVEVQNGGFFCNDLYGGSPDGLVGDDGLIEIKSVIAFTHYTNVNRGTYPPSAMWQIVGNLEATGRDWLDFISYCAEYPIGKRLLVYRIYKEQVETELKALKIRRLMFLDLVDKTENNIRKL